MIDSNDMNLFIIAEQKWFAKNLPVCRGRRSGSSGQGVHRELSRLTA